MIKKKREKIESEAHDIRTRVPMYIHTYVLSTVFFFSYKVHYYVRFTVNKWVYMPGQFHVEIFQVGKFVYTHIEYERKIN